MKECQQTLPQLRQNRLAMPQLHPERPNPQLITRGHESRISTEHTSCCEVVRCARLLPEAVWIRMHFATEITQRSGHRIPETADQRQRFTAERLMIQHGWRVPTALGYNAHAQIVAFLAMFSTASPIEDWRIRFPDSVSCSNSDTCRFQSVGCFCCWATSVSLSFCLRGCGR